MSVRKPGAQMNTIGGHVVRTVVLLALSVFLVLVIAAGAGALPVFIEVVSVSSSGAPANVYSQTKSPSISADGRYVVFNSSADNLVAGDTNNQSDIFLRDTVAGTTTRISTDSAGNQADNSSTSPTISADGRHVAFASWAGNLVPGSTTSREDVYIKNVETGEIARVSTDSAGNQANGNSVGQYGQLAISGDGRYVAFVSSATNLVPGDTDESCYGANCPDVFVKDTQTGSIAMASSDASSLPANGFSLRPSLSNDGRYVAFDSNATNLAAGDAYNDYAVFRKDLKTGAVDLVADSPTGGFNSHSPSISANGNEIAFVSNYYSISVKHMDSGVVTHVYGHVISGGIEFGDSPSISADGRFVEFAEWNGPPGDHGGRWIEVVADTATGTRVIMSDYDGYDGYISADGRYVAFTLTWTQLVDQSAIGAQAIYRAGTGMPQTTGRPSLSLSRSSVYWQSYADYTSRLLSVDYRVTNTGADTAYAAQITGSSASNGVSAVSIMPLSLGNLVPGAAHAATIRYSIPAGVTDFRATLMATAKDGAGSSYSY